MVNKVILLGEPWSESMAQGLRIGFADYNMHFAMLKQTGYLSDKITLLSFLHSAADITPVSFAAISRFPIVPNFPIHRRYLIQPYPALERQSRS